MGNFIDLTGKRFGRWTVIKRGNGPSKRGASWLCRCDCGKESVVYGNRLRVGESLSCGCFRSENTIRMNTRHGLYGTLEYSSWAHMKNRCFSPNCKKYKDYGGRGITVCQRWQDSFENFFSDMGKRPSKNHSIDRINNNGNYEPDNCRWATPVEQTNNTRRNKR